MSSIGKHLFGDTMSSIPVDYVNGLSTLGLGLFWYFSDSLIVIIAFGRSE
jgi:hypothetical protein